MPDTICRCGHPRHQHADRDSPLQVVPLAMTEADAGDRPDLDNIVEGAGHCTEPGCGCREFTDAEP
jgi:hypothetical protein